MMHGSYDSDSAPSLKRHLHCFGGGWKSVIKNWIVYNTSFTFLFMTYDAAIEKLAVSKTTNDAYSTQCMRNAQPSPHHEDEGEDGVADIKSIEWG